MSDSNEKRRYCGLLNTMVTRKGCQTVADFDKKEREIDPAASSGCCDCEWAEQEADDER